MNNSSQNKKYNPIITNIKHLNSKIILNQLKILKN